MKRYSQFKDYHDSSKWLTIMKRALALLFVVLMVGFFLAAAANAEANQKGISQEEEYFLFVEFYHPMSVDKLAMSIGNANITVRDWTFHWNEYTAVNFPKEKVSLRAAGIEFENDYKTALTSILEQLETEDDPLFLKGHEKEKEEERYAQTRAALERESEQLRQALSRVDTEVMSMVKLTLQGKKSVLLDFVERNKPEIRSYDLIPVSEYGNNKPNPKDVNGQASNSSSNSLSADNTTNLYSDPWKFAPEQGWVRNNTQSGFIESVFIWWDKSGFNNVHKGYEHDMIIWADKGVYVEPGSTYISNLPDWYEDTTFLDTKAVFTNGSANATNVQSGNVYWSSVKLDVINPDYPYWLENWQNVGGDIEPQIGSWAGAYNDPEPPPEWEEIAFCAAHFNAPKWCLFADQTYFIGYPPQMYYDSNSAYVDFPFRHDLDRKYYWYKGYNAGWLQCPQGTFKGWYINPDTGNTIFARCDGSSISFDWGSDGPNHGVNDDNFKVQWTGDFDFPVSGVYEFTATADDGIRVWIDGWDWNNNLVIDGWNGPGTFSAYRYVSAGTHRVNVIYHEVVGLASVNLTWYPITTQSQQ